MDSPQAERIENWKPTIRVKTLASRVLVVAQTRIEGTWKAYIDAVPGERHDHEWQSVSTNGNEVPEEIARILFQEFEEIPYAR